MGKVGLVLKTFGLFLAMALFVNGFLLGLFAFKEWLASLFGEQTATTISLVTIICLILAILLGQTIWGDE